MGLFGWLKQRRKSGTPPIDLKHIEMVIGYRFNDPWLLYRSLKHRSYTQELEGTIDLSNERLEFLGDTVFNLVVSQAIYLDNPDYNEGDLTKLKSILVSRDSAAIAGKRAGIHRFMLLSESEEGSGGRDRSSIIADTYEAVVGAIFLDGGFEEAGKFVKKTVLNDSHLDLSREHRNYKSLLLELTQADKLGHPRYRTITESGPDHDKVFTVEVSVMGEPCGTGSGKSKKIAQQMAAKACLEKLETNSVIGPATQEAPGGTAESDEV